MITIENFNWLLYATMLLLLSPIVFLTLYWLVYYPIKPTYKKEKGDRKKTNDYEIIGFDPIGNKVHKIVAYVISFLLTILLCIFCFILIRK